jgi:hypothetical protein
MDCNCAAISPDYADDRGWKEENGKAPDKQDTDKVPREEEIMALG